MTWLKDPEAVLDYTFDWSAWLAASETISAHTVAVADGITLDSEAEVDGVVTVWLSGGTAGTRYAVACLITTNQGRTDERTRYVDVRER